MALTDMLSPDEARRAREAEAALIARANDPDDEYDGSDSMSRLKGDA